MNFTEKIKKYREENGMTQKQQSDILNVSVQTGHEGNKKT